MSRDKDLLPLQGQVPFPGLEKTEAVLTRVAAGTWNLSTSCSQSLPLVMMGEESAPSPHSRQSPFHTPLPCS